MSEEYMLKNLTESEAKYHSIVENSDEIVVIFQDGKIVFLNQKGKDLSGYSEQDPIWENPLDFIHPEDQALMKERLLMRMNGMEVPPSSEFRAVNKNGDAIWIRTKVKNIIWDGHSAFLFFLTDISALKKSEESSRENADKYKTILEEIEEGYFETDLKGNFVFVNSWICKNAGMTPDEILGMNFQSYSLPATIRRLRRTFYRIYTSGQPEKISGCEFMMRDGFLNICELRVSLRRDSEGAPVGFRGLSHDITGRTLTERALRKSEERYRTILESIDEGYYEVDLRGTLTFVNDAMCRIMGLDRKALIGLNNRDYTDSATAKKTYAIFNEVYRSGRASELRDYEISIKNHSRQIWEMKISLLHDSSGKPIGFRGIVRDVTKRRKEERALYESEERYRTILENTGTAIVLVENDRIIFAGGEFEKLSGYSRNEIEGKMKWTEFFTNEEQKRIMGQHKIILSNQAYGSPSDEFSFITRSGTTRSIYVITTIIPGTRQTLFSLIDITEYKQLENKYLQAQKMEAIGTLAGGIAHNFNNLLMGIQGNTSLMLMDLNPNHPHYRRLKNIEHQIDEGAELTKQLLGFAREGKYEIKRININNILEITLNFFEKTRKDIKIRKSFQQDLWIAAVDQSQMEQVFMNMYVNAWQAMPGGGELKVETCNCFLSDEDVRSFGAKPGRYIQINISDTGEGMDKETKKHIFEPFFTTKVSRGSGLGMASAYGIIKNHDGFIVIDSEKGKGTVFRIYLPSFEKDKSDDRGVSKERPLGGNETILLVDDEQLIIEVAMEILAALGYKILTAKSGREALRVYRQNQECVDLVILDMIMPHMSGGEVFDRIKLIDKNAKVLLSSGFSADGEAQEIIRRGCSGFIQKPFNISKLSSKIREILD
ncbi:MAG: PAS domain S-box protein [Syntrophales bacterium]|nr:PAS domain S-box protein [Syntrophales bacterium]